MGSGISSAETAGDDHDHVARTTVMECVNRHRQLVSLNLEQDQRFSLEELRALYADAPDALFRRAVKLFDWTATGNRALENVKMFSLLMVALLHPRRFGCEGGRRTQFDVAFAIFDHDESGQLDFSEFQAMCYAMHATRLSALKVVYTSKVGHAMLHDMAEKEHSPENIEFLDDVEAWAHLPDDQRGIEAAGGLLDRYVGAQAMTPLNLPHQTCSDARRAYEAARAAGADTLDARFFDDVKREVFKVLEKDMFARFDRDRQRMTEIMRAAFDEVDVDHTGRISKEQYVVWAKKNPEVLVFYDQLTKMTHHIDGDQRVTYRHLTKPTRPAPRPPPRRRRVAA